MKTELRGGQTQEITNINQVWTNNRTRFFQTLGLIYLGLSCLKSPVWFSAMRLNFMAVQFLLLWQRKSFTHLSSLCSLVSQTYKKIPNFKKVNIQSLHCTQALYSLCPGKKWWNEISLIWHVAIKLGSGKHRGKTSHPGEVQ